MNIRVSKWNIYIDFKDIFLKTGFLLLFPLVFFINNSPSALMFYEYIPIYFKNLHPIDYAQILILLVLIYLVNRGNIKIRKN